MRAASGSRKQWMTAALFPLVLAAGVSVDAHGQTSQTPQAHTAGHAMQEPSVALRDELLMHFEMSMDKFIGLAKAMPADRFTWSPGEGVMEVGHVYMHVANYNYAYPSQNMGVAAPAGVKLDGLEAIRTKAEVVGALEQSRAYVLENVRKMSAADLDRATKLYGRDIQQWGVLVQLVTHMNEHLGQAIAYARMNGITPPWSN